MSGQEKGDLNERFHALLKKLRKVRRGTWLMIIALIAFLWSFLGMQLNPNPGRRVENAEPFVWQKNCTKAMVDEAIKNAWGYPNLPCACFTPQNEIKDWYARGLAAFGKDPDESHYYRIGNDAVQRWRRDRWSPWPRCLYYNHNSSFGKDFFIVNEGIRKDD